MHEQQLSAINRVASVVGDEHLETLISVAEVHYRTIPDSVDIRRSTEQRLWDEMLPVIKNMTVKPVEAIRLNLNRKGWSWDRIDGITPELEQEAFLAVMLGTTDKREIYNALARYVYVDTLSRPLTFDPPEQSGNGTMSPEAAELSEALRQTATTDRKQWILEFLRRNYHQPEMADELDCSPRTIRRDIRQMRESTDLSP